MPGNERDDLALLIDVVRGAGDVALQYSAETARVWHKPNNAGPVTDADIAVNTYLHNHLQTARPDYGWLSEETEDAETRHQEDTVFIVDPIDGTRNFIEGGRTWAHSVAIVRAGIVEAGVVFLPARNMLFAAARGAGATLNGEALAASRQVTATGARVLSARPVLDTQFWLNDVPQIDRAYRPSLAYRLALVAQGRFDGMMTFRPTWEWDIAAGSLIAAEAGASVTDRAGRTLSFNAPDPRTHGVIAAAPRLHEALVAAHDPDAGHA